MPALPQERLDALKLAHDLGFSTWVSFEPVIYPRDSRALITKCAPFVDLFKVGTMNYHEQGKLVDWKTFAIRTIELFKELKITNYILKNDLKAYLDRV